MTLDWSSQQRPANRIRRWPPGLCHPISCVLHFGSFCSTLWKCYSKTLGRGLKVGTEGHAAILLPAWGHVPLGCEERRQQASNMMVISGITTIAYWSTGISWSSESQCQVSPIMFPRGGKARLEETGSGQNKWETRQNAWEHQKHNDHGAFTFWFRSSHPTKIAILFTRLKFYLLLNRFNSLLVHSTRFPVSHTGYFLTHLLTVCLLGAKAVSFVTQPCSVTWALIHAWSF